MTNDGESAPEPVPRDAAWFEALFAAHTDAVHRFLLRRGAASDAEDLCADVLTTAWRRRDDLPEGHELAWLYRTAGYVLANHRRKHRPVPVAEVPDDPDRDSAPDPADLALADSELTQVLTALSPKDRHVLLLHAWEGLDGVALGHALGISRGGAAAALSRARARLREVWEERVGA
ncbi:RNA polymerase sigma factor [Ruania alba]|uniref:RNA polymerase sigma-70 factor, ECF subfamily n=1 Tax=Ruania alba TaxID=648782 RepID=A0A1H5MQG8_9MICO|nr:sigma-70 family RNA polymerase sigma factor [Ruania alba]SEE91632.1 RNA polymerase sigma-70 factor, ECF subfamily [Ruania alba]